MSDYDTDENCAAHDSPCCEVCAYERGFAAGVEAAAKHVEKWWGGGVEAAKGIRALAAPVEARPKPHEGEHMNSEMVGNDKAEQDMNHPHRMVNESGREKFIHALDDLILRAGVVEPERTQVIGLLVDAYGEVGNEERLRGFWQGVNASRSALDTLVAQEPSL